MVYAVDRYMDVIKVKEAIGKVPGLDRYQYFDTEVEACKFIVRRSYAELAKADKAQTAAERRMRKCEKKFGFRF